ncbi:unnamed protein product [Acanthosepion pharaonis]|uniref:Uncharacterized protein n=1 Tax=Acanthosepion pharaonis TaxID=158019 RepID=A0A812BGB2_ACAPH|nr:unnamed protein product [Sepia pharaonis]
MIFPVTLIPGYTHSFLLLLFFTFISLVVFLITLNTGFIHPFLHHLFFCFLFLLLFPNFMLSFRSSLLMNLPSVSNRHSERLMTHRIPLSNNAYTTILSEYALTLDAYEEIKDAFSESLDAALQEVSRTDKIILLGDFNARVGSNILQPEKPKPPLHSMLPVLNKHQNESNLLNVCQSLLAPPTDVNDQQEIDSLWDSTILAIRTSCNAIAPVRFPDGSTLLKEKEEILARWAEHFKELLNRDMLIDSSALDELPTLPGLLELNSVPTSDKSGTLQGGEVRSTRREAIPVSSAACQFRTVHVSLPPVPESLSFMDWAAVSFGSSQKTDIEGWTVSSSAMTDSQEGWKEG